MRYTETKKFFLYIAIGGAFCIGILSLLSIRWDFGGDIIFQGFATYLVTLLAFWAITQLPTQYEKFSKVNPAILNGAIWLWTISILLVTLLSYLAIWNLIEADAVFYWKLIITILIINFVCFASVFSLERWWDNNEEDKTH